ncbi:hemagglutinin repeat-containing protein, partial [Acetonema longum]
GAFNTFDSHSTTEFKQNGFTVSIGNGFLQSVQGTYDTIDRSQDIQDDRLKALYGLKAYRSGEKAYDGIQEARQNAEKSDIGSSFNVTAGFSSSKQKTEATASAATVRGSSLTSSGDINLIATGSGQTDSIGKAADGDLNILGSSINGNNVYLSAARDVNLKAQANTTDSIMKSSGSSYGFGASFSLGKELGMGYYLEGNKSSGNSEEHAINWTETMVTGNTNLSIISGRDTNLIGAQAHGDSINMNVGRNLNLESLQDRETYREKNKSAGGSLSYSSAKGVGGKASTYERNIKSNYSSVNEQTGIFAGDGGFDIYVEGNTDLKGAVIASKASADKNRLSTGTLTFSDITNRSEYSASSAGITIEKDIRPKGSPEFGDSKESTTQSAIASEAIEIRSDENKPADEKTDLSKLSRDTDNAHQPLDNIFDKVAVSEKLEMREIIVDELVDQVYKEIERKKVAEEAANEKDVEEAKKEEKVETAEEKIEKKKEEIAQKLVELEGQLEGINDAQKVQYLLQQMEFNIGQSGVDGDLGVMSTSSLIIFQHRTEGDITGTVDQ